MLVVENVCISQIYIFTNEREMLLFNMYPSELHTSLKKYDVLQLLLCIYRLILYTQGE